MYCHYNASCFVIRRRYVEDNMILVLLSPWV